MSRATSKNKLFTPSDISKELTSNGLFSNTDSTEGTQTYNYFITHAMYVHAQKHVCWCMPTLTHRNSHVRFSAVCQLTDTHHAYKLIHTPNKLCIIIMYTYMYIVCVLLLLSVNCTCTFDFQCIQYSDLEISFMGEKFAIWIPPSLHQRKNCALASDHAYTHAHDGSI